MFSLTLALCASIFAASAPAELPVRPDLPLEPGTTWVYELTETTDPKGDGKLETRRWKETVRIARTETTSSGFVVVRESVTEPKAPGEETRVDWLVSGGRVYEFPHRHEMSLDELATTEPIFSFPMKVGASWSSDERESADREAAKKFENGEGPAPNPLLWYRIVERVADVTTPAGEFKECFEIWHRTNPDHTIVWFKPGVGVVKWQTVHHGSRWDQEALLVRFTQGQ